jgi:hypothetical protein
MVRVFDSRFLTACSGVSDLFFRFANITSNPTQKGATVLVRLIGGFMYSRGETSKLSARLCPASVSMSLSGVEQSRQIGSSTSRGLCAQKNNVLMVQKMKDRVDNFSVVTASPWMARPTICTRNQMICSVVKRRANQSALFLSQISVRLILGHAKWPLATS